MITVSRHDIPLHDCNFEVDRLRRLANDLERISKGNHPDKSMLSSAPCIEGWKIVVRPVPCLTGLFFGHPGIEEGDLGVTTEMMAFAPTLGYARTVTRFYKLGQPEGGSSDLAQ
ncbi:hypothetical protein ACFWXH_04540 [Mesorhizobium sp. NPDC059054]|uniref:hypothetical protein n=1 Tax=Mesorhizobium sp. NPDC059054 TaxID=3346711 RepID=UPI00368BFCA6